MAKDDVAVVQRAGRGVLSGAAHPRTSTVRGAVHTRLSDAAYSAYRILLTDAWFSSLVDVRSVADVVVCCGGAPLSVVQRAAACRRSDGIRTK